MRLDNGDTGIYRFWISHLSLTGGRCIMLKVGDTAPDFTLMTNEGQPLSLSSLRGRKVLLWFYPKADTPG